MRNSIQKLSFLIVVLVMALAFSGCATRQYVRHQVGAVEPQIAEVRDAQAEQAERIDAVDRRAQNGVNAAHDAGIAANVANDRAVAADRRAMDADRRADTAQQNAQRALNRVDMVEIQIESKIANLDKYGVTDQKTVIFKFDSDELSKETLGMLDEIASRFSGLKTGYVIELQGFTDNIGTEAYNFNLSERRADSVLRYLVSKNVPLYRISIVGLGKTNPVADNKTNQGREQNRRVDIRVLTAPATVSTANR